MIKGTCRREGLWGSQFQRTSLWPSWQGAGQQARRHGAEAVNWEVTPDPQAGDRGRERNSVLVQLGVVWAFKTSKPTLSDKTVFPNSSQIIPPPGVRVFKHTGFGWHSLSNHHLLRTFGHFYILAITNKSPRNIHAQGFVWNNSFHSSGINSQDCRFQGSGR